MKFIILGDLWGLFGCIWVVRPSAAWRAPLHAPKTQVTCQAPTSLILLSFGGRLLRAEPRDED